MSDLASLMKLAPTVGAGFAGINQRQGEQMEALKQMELSQIMQNRGGAEVRAQALHPFALDKANLDNQGLKAGLPGIMADSSLKQTNATKAAGTLESDIEAGNVENRMKAFKSIGTHLGSIASEVESASDIEKPAAFVKALQGMQIPPKAALSLIKRYGSTPPSELVKRLREDGERMLRENETYVRTLDQQRLQEQGANSRNAASNASQQKIEQMRIDAGKYNRNTTANSVQAALLKARNPVQKAEILEDAYYTAEAAGDEEAAKVYKQRAIEARQRAAEDAKNRGIARPDVDPNQFGIGTTPDPSATAPIAGGNGGAPKPENGRITVVSPDGKRGSIPANQLEQALKQGFKKVQ